jgi:hypothetical protein
LTDRTLFLDPEPLFAHIKKRLADIAADDAGDALSRKVPHRVARAADDPLAARSPGDRAARRTDAGGHPGGAGPRAAQHHRELLAEMENAGEFWDTLIAADAGGSSRRARSIAGSSSRTKAPNSFRSVR